MSELQNIKSIVFHGLKDKPEDLRKATLRVFAEIDQDLDLVEYEPSSSVEDAIEELDNILKIYEIDVEDDTGITSNRPTIGNLPEDLDESLRRPTIGNLPKDFEDDDNN